MRDSQRKKVYDSEKVAFKENNLSSPRTLPNITDVQKFVNKVWLSERVRGICPEAFGGFYLSPPKVSDGRGRRRGCALGAFEIKMPKVTRREWYVLHELAHIIETRKFNVSGKPSSEEPASHGWEFCETYLKLVLYILGREQHDALKHQFKEHKVKFREPVKRKVSPEQREANIIRLAEYRKAA